MGEYSSQLVLIYCDSDRPVSYSLCSRSSICVDNTYFMESEAVTGMTITLERLTSRRQIYLPVVFVDSLSFSGL